MILKPLATVASLYVRDNEKNRTIKKIFSVLMAI